MRERSRFDIGKKRLKIVPILIAIVVGLILLSPLLISGNAMAGGDSADVLVNNEAELNAALSGAAGTTDTPYVIEITASFNITSAKTVAAGKYVKLVSTEGSTFTLTRSNTSVNMFDVQGSLILENIIIDGNGAATAKNTVKVSSGATFEMQPGSVLQNANCTSASGGAAVYNQGTFNLNGGTVKNNTSQLTASVTGAVIYNSGTFTMTAGSMTGNKALGMGGDSGVSGGVVYNTSGAVFTMSGGVIGGSGTDKNEAACSDWGGISGGVVYNAGTFNMSQNALIKGNKLSRSSGWPYASIYGGAVYNSGTFTMSDSAEISENSGNINYSYTYGLGVYSSGTSARFTMQDNAVIKDNTGAAVEGNSNFKGGGVFNSGGSQFMMQGSAKISGNQLSSTTASSYGAGVDNEGVGSVFTMKGSAVISNNSVSASGNCFGGGVYNVSSAQFDFQSGMISGNSVTSTGGGSFGGGVYSYNNTTFTMSGGTITGNSTNSTAAGSYSRGGGVFTSNATFGLSGGTISSNQANNTNGYSEGGGVFNWNIFNMTGGTITGNAAKNGGGVCNYATFNLSGSAEISSNTASAEGGGVENTNGGFAMSGGSIAGNTAPKGKGVLNAAIFSMSGSASVDTDNDVYLDNGQKISVTADLTGTSPLAIITPAAYSAGSTVVAMAAGLSANAYVSKFEIAPNGTTPWGVKANAQSLLLAPGAIYLNGATGLDTNDGSTKATAVATFEKAASLLGSPGTIYICGTVTIPSGNDSSYTWTLPSGQTIKRYEDPVTSASDFTGIMIQLNGNLTLQNIVIDGGWNAATGMGVEAAKPIIEESATGNLTINSGAALQNNSIVIANSTEDHLGSGVHGRGSVAMNGGTISGNQIQILSGSAILCGGAGIAMESGTLTMTGGTISGNALASDYALGGGVYVGSGNTFTMTGGTIGGSFAVDANTAGRGGGIYNAGTINMSGGSISGNTATGDQMGGGVFNQSVFNLKGSASITGNTTLTGGGVYNFTGHFSISDSASIDGNTATSGGGGVYSNGSGYLTMDGGSISNNTAAAGGGIGVQSGTFTMTGGSIDGNSAGEGGGIMGLTASTLNINGGTVSGNSASATGGGIESGSNLNIRGGTITDNTASTGAGVYIYGGTFSLTGGALITQNNPVYLATNRSITVTGALSNSPAAWVMPATYPNAGENVKVAAASYTGATGATVLNALAAANGAYGLQASGNDVNLVKKLDAAITLADASVTYTGSAISYSGTVTKPNDVSLSDLAFLYKLKTADDSAYTTTAPISAGVYSVKATLTGNAKYNDTASNVATLTIVIPNAQTPVFTVNLSGAYSYNNYAFTCNLKVKASVSDNGVLTYQWYRNTVNSATGGTRITGATGDSYKVPTAINGTVYYYVIATNTLDNDANRAASATSNIVKVKVSVTEPEPTDAPDTEGSPEVSSTPEITQSPTPTPSDGAVPQATPAISQNQNDIVIKIVPVTPNTPAVTVSNTEGFSESVLTQEEKNAMQDGENITITLVVERVDIPVNAGDDEIISGNMGGNTLGMYLNVELLKQIGEGQQQNILNTSKPIRIVLAVPPELLKDGRNYSVIRVHGDETTVLSDLDNDPATVTIETDRFSTYALVYQDGPVVSFWLILLICVLIVVLIICLIWLVRRRKRGSAAVDIIF